MDSSYVLDQYYSVKGWVSNDVECRTVVDRICISKKMLSLLHDYIYVLMMSLPKTRDKDINVSIAFIGLTCKTIEKCVNNCLRHRSKLGKTMSSIIFGDKTIPFHIRIRLCNDIGAYDIVFKPDKSIQQQNTSTDDGRLILQKTNLFELTSVTHRR